MVGPSKTENVPKDTEPVWADGSGWKCAALYAAEHRSWKGSSEASRLTLIQIQRGCRDDGSLFIKSFTLGDGNSRLPLVA